MSSGCGQLTTESRTIVKPGDFAGKPIALIAVAFLAWSTPASRSSSQADVLEGRTKRECLSAAAHDPKSAGTPTAVISAFCQCSAVAIVRSLTPVEISLALTNGGKTVPDEKVQAAAELCVDTVRKAQLR